MGNLPEIKNLVSCILYLVTDLNYILVRLVKTISRVITLLLCGELYASVM